MTHLATFVILAPWMHCVLISLFHPHSCSHEPKRLFIAHIPVVKLNCNLVTTFVFYIKLTVTRAVA